MPLWDYECKDCGYVWEAFEWSSGYGRPEVCPKCGWPNITKCFSSLKRQIIRGNADAIKHELPDPSPPLEELRGKTKRGCEGGYEDKPYADTNINHYTHEHDKHGNTIWKEKRRTYFGAGGSRKSSAEKE